MGSDPTTGVHVLRLRYNVLYASDSQKFPREIIFLEGYLTTLVFSMKCDIQHRWLSRTNTFSLLKNTTLKISYKHTQKKRNYRYKGLNYSW
jgi:hypothetical protein